MCRGRVRQRRCDGRETSVNDVRAWPNATPGCSRRSEADGGDAEEPSRRCAVKNKKKTVGFDGARFEM